MAISLLQPDLRIADGGSHKWEARLFGPFRLTAPDGSDATPQGRKTRALIAFLFATNDDDATTRDRLCGLFYSERSEEQARASLRQLLYEMRVLTSGPEPLVVVDRFRARIAPMLAATDLAEMQALAESGDAAGLAALIGHQPPDLLTDLDGIDPGFDDWLAVQRVRRADERRRIVLEATERATTQGRPAIALRLATCLLARDPTDEVAARLAMIASHRQGDQDQVRSTLARLKHALREDLDVAPSQETQDLYQRLSTTPTVDAVDAVDPQADGTAVRRAAIDTIDHDDRSPESLPDTSVTATTGHVATPSRETRLVPVPTEDRRRKTTMAAVIGAIVVVLVCAGLDLRGRTGHVDRHLLRVDALHTPQGDAAGQVLGVGFANTLARLVFATDTTLDVIDAGQSSQSIDRQRTFAIDGEARSDGSRLHVDLRLRRESDGAMLWSATFSRPIVEVEALREQMAYRIAGVTICATGRRNPAVDGFSVESLRLLFAACAQMRLDDNEVVENLKKLVDQQPDFAHGWAMLALATARTAGPGAVEEAAGLAEALRLADRALALDPHDGLAYGAKAMTFGPLKTWPQRMRLLEQGRAVEPANGDVIAMIAGSLAEIGRLNESIVLAKQAFEIDPFDPRKAVLRANLLAASDDGPDAKVALQVARRRFPTNDEVALADFRYNAYLGDSNRALAMVSDPDRGFNLQPVRAKLWNAVIAARAAPSTVHGDVADEAFLASRRVLGDGAGLPDVAMLSALDRIDEAFAVAADIDTSHYDEQTALLFTTLTGPLRRDPRFMALADRLGLVEVWRQAERWPDFCSDRSVPYDCKVEATRVATSRSP